MTPFEPLQSVELKILSMKSPILLNALPSIKKVWDLQAFSVDESCLKFGPADSSATLRPQYLFFIYFVKYLFCLIMAFAK